MTPEQRLQAFRKFVEQKPDDAFARYSLAMALRSAGQVAAAADEFAELARRQPDYVPTWLMWGQSLETLGRDAEAADIYARGIATANRAGNGHAAGELGQALDALRARGTAR